MRSARSKAAISAAMTTGPDATQTARICLATTRSPHPHRSRPLCCVNRPGVSGGDAQVPRMCLCHSAWPGGGWAAHEARASVIDASAAAHPRRQSIGRWQATATRTSATSIGTAAGDSRFRVSCHPLRQRLGRARWPIPTQAGNRCLSGRWAPAAARTR